MASETGIRSLRLGVVALACALSTGAMAQVKAQPPSQPPSMDPKQTVPEKVDPPLNADKPGTPDTTGTIKGRSLSEQLNKSDGVITPPPGTDPGISAPAPVPNPGTTPVIPPPNGQNSTVDPK